MKISYWDCPYSNYDEYWDGENETRIYGCKHPNGNHVCNLENKHSMLDDCHLLDEYIERERK